MYKNSSKSYERLNWDNAICAPIVCIDDTITIVGEDFPTLQRDRVVLKKDSEITIGGKVSALGLTLPPQPVSSIIDTNKVPIIVMNFFKKMQNWFSIMTLKRVPLSFFSITLPNTHKINIHKKIKEYGTLKHEDQIRYLRNNIFRYINDSKIKNYIIVYETTAKGVIHLHTVWQPILSSNITEIPDSYKDIPSYFNIDKSKIINQNFVEVSVNNPQELAEYLCKIELDHKIK